MVREDQADDVADRPEDAIVIEGRILECEGKGLLSENNKPLAALLRATHPFLHTMSQDIDKGQGQLSEQNLIWFLTFKIHTTLPPHHCNPLMHNLEDLQPGASRSKTG